MSLRKERKRKVFNLLDEDPEWATEVVLKKGGRKESTKLTALPTAPAQGLSADLQNASHHIEQRRGVYFKYVLASGYGFVVMLRKENHPWRWS
jgi:hypothetical protein